MAFITIEEFAEMHDVSPQAVRYAIKPTVNKLKFILRYGKKLINDTQKYEPVRGRGRKPVDAIKKKLK